MIVGFIRVVAIALPLVPGATAFDRRELKDDA
jgi:hypothetical protein